jgi:uncharacterized membrane protein (DUF485 family)
MSAAAYDHIRRNPKFQQLVAARNRLAIQLSIVMLTIYFGFILIIAFAPGVLGASLAGGVTTVGIPVGILVIVAAFVLTGVYVSKANSDFDRLTGEILKEVK